MFGVGRDLCGSPSPTPLPKQGHLQQAAQDLVQAGLDADVHQITLVLVNWAKHELERGPPGPLAG